MTRFQTPKGIKTHKAFGTMLRLAILSVALLLVAGHLGFLHQSFDSIAVFRLHLLPVLGVMLIATFRLKMPVLRIFGGAVAMVSVVTIAPSVREMGTGPIEADWRLFQQNMMVRNRQPADVAQFIMDRKPEFVSLQEISHNGLSVLEPLKARYPGWLQCPDWYGAGVVLMSRWQAVQGSQGCDAIEKIGWMQVQTAQGPLTVVAVHMNWPWPSNYAGRQRRVQRILGELPQPMVIAGDFNMVPWATSVQRLERRTGTEVVTPLRFSFRPKGLQALLPIDHVMVPAGMQARSALVPGLGAV